MDVKSLVPRLEQLAFTVSFEEILGNLYLCPDHCQKEKQFGQNIQFASLLPPKIRNSLTSENILNFVRKRLDYHLVGLVSDTTRKEYVKKFNETWQLKGNVIESWAFLDCVLDESFKELEIRAALPGSEPDSRLISTIAECSSELQELKIDFRLMKIPIEVEKICPLITSLSSLKYLTCLNLHQMREAHRSVLKLIGNASPLLTHLSISGFCVTANDIFSLIFGKFFDELFPGNRVFPQGPLALIELLQAPSEILTPFCFTLRHLQLSFGSDMYTDKFYSLAAFILRHLPSLEKMDGHLTSFGVEKLQFSTFSTFPTFSGVLSLLSLDCVYLNSDMVQSIPKFCPQLKEVTFFMASSQCAVHLDDGGFRVEDSSPEKVQEYLKAWPKLETITLEGITPEFAKVILKTFASSLKSVTYSCCSKINLIDLVPCRQLESLSILKNSTLEESNYAEPASPSSFLPHLKSFQSDICLGLWSLCLEGKSDLTNVVLNCYHTGANASNHSDYYNISKMWPKVESVELRQCDGLTVSMLSNFIPLLVKLKELTLPEIVATSDPKLAAKIWEEFRYRPSPVHLFFTNDRVYQRCFSIPALPDAPVVYAGAIPLDDGNSESGSEETDSDSEDSDL